MLADMEEQTAAHTDAHAKAPVMDIAPPKHAEDPETAVHEAPPPERTGEEPKSAPKPDSGSSKPKPKPQPKPERNSGTGAAIAATVIIVLGLAAMATYAYIRTQN